MSLPLSDRATNTLQLHPLQNERERKARASELVGESSAGVPLVVNLKVRGQEKVAVFSLMA